jgi:hypothetical protein
MILSLVLIILILYTYYYLVELSNCPCFVSNQDDKLYLDYMKFYLILDLFSILIALFLLNTKIPNSLLIFSVLLVVFIHGYMTYNVYHFYNSIKAYCSCANQWQKYFVYYEGIVAGLVTLQYVISFLFIIIFLIHNRS